MHAIGMADEEGDNEETDASSSDENRTYNDANLEPATAHDALRRRHTIDESAGEQYTLLPNMTYTWL